MFYIISSKKNKWSLLSGAGHFEKLLLVWSSQSLLTEQHGSFWTTFRETYIEDFVLTLITETKLGENRTTTDTLHKDLRTVI